MSGNRFFAAALFATLVASGCATTQVVSRFKMPARSRVMNEKQRVLLKEFDGGKGRETTMRLRQAITAGGLHAQVGANDAERARQVQLALQSGGEAALAESGPEGATVIIAGGTPPDQYDSQVTTDKQRECVAKNKKGKCTEMKEFTYYTLKESCTAQIAFRITRVADNQQVITRTASGSARTSERKRNSPPPSVRSKLCASAYADAMFETITFLTPFTTTQALEFHKVDKDSGMTDRAMNAVKTANLEQARGIIEKLIEEPALSDTARGWARYNLALVLYGLGRFDDCAQQIEMAGSVGSESIALEHLRVCREYLQ